MKIGPYRGNTVIQGDANELVRKLPDESIDVAITSPPYWGQRTSDGNGVEADPREYLVGMREFFLNLLPKLKQDGLLWLNIGDAYNTPVNWRASDHAYSTLGPDGTGLDPDNSAYTKNRYRRRAYLDRDETWLSYGNLLALPYRLIIGLSSNGYLYRGEIIWRKKNPMPEGRCRRPHRQHESIYLLGKSEQHRFRITPPVGSVWEFPNEKILGHQHRSRFPVELPRRCLEASDLAPGAVVLDPYNGSGTTGVAAIAAGATYLGFEIDADQVDASQTRLNAAIEKQQLHTA
jgi:DNA modification methylase